jgi:putative spermidine/putrescine transport system permease protein
MRGSTPRRPLILSDRPHRRRASGKVVMVSEYIRVSLEQTLRWGLAAMLASTMLIATFFLIVLVSRLVDLRTMYGAK